MVNTYPIAQLDDVRRLKFEKPPHVAIIEARYYTELSDMLLTGAGNVLEQINPSSFHHNFEIITVAGALEIPLALQMAAQSRKFDGYIVLGSVIRGDTTHYETVCNESNRGVMDVSLKFNLPVGNAILTVENMDQAIDRADPARMNKGGGAAIAMLRQLSLQHYLGTK